MTDEIEEDRPVEERAREAAQAAAERAAAYVLYVEACEEMDTEPKAALEDLSQKAQGKWLKKAEALLGPQAQTPQTPQGQSVDRGQQHSNADAVSSLAGRPRVEDRDPRDETFYDEDGNWQPPTDTVILKVSRGNMVLPLRMPVELLAPDVAGGTDKIIEYFKEAFMRTGQSGQPSQPVQPNLDYALRNGSRTFKGRERLRYADFTEELPEEPGLPGLSLDFVDVGPQARTAPQGPPPTPGMPVVIEGGAVIGRPVAGAAPAQQPQQGRPTQGSARLG